MTQEYIQKLREHLKGFSAEEQEVLLEEIRSHIESGIDDPNMGKDENERKKKLMDELGSPKELGRGFKESYRKERFIDYLLILVPYLLYPFLNMLYVSLMPKYSWADVRLDILIHLPLVAIGLWRRSALLTSFWITTLVAQIITMLLLVGNYYGSFQTGVWITVALGLVFLLVYLVWQNRHDSLVTAFALLPLMMCCIGTVLAIIHPSADTSYTFGQIDKLLLDVYINVAGFGSGYLPFYGFLATLGLFFLSMNRNIRWFALGLYGLVIGLSRNYLNLFDSDKGLMHPLAYLLFAILPLVLVFLGWVLSQSKLQTKFAE
jgi:hypothetical protein